MLCFSLCEPSAAGSKPCPPGGMRHSPPFEPLARPLKGSRRSRKPSTARPEVIPPGERGVPSLSSLAEEPGEAFPPGQVPSSMGNEAFKRGNEILEGGNEARTAFTPCRTGSRAIPRGERALRSLPNPFKGGERGIPSFPEGSRSGERVTNPDGWLVLPPWLAWSGGNTGPSPLRRGLRLRCVEECRRQPIADLRQLGQQKGERQEEPSKADYERCRVSSAPEPFWKRAGER